MSPLNLEKKDFSQPAHRSPSNYLGSALVEAAEKLEFAWHDCLPVKRIKAGITEMTLEVLAFAAVVALCATR